MNCWRVQNLIAPFLDGELPHAETEALAEHLEACPDCATQVEAVASLPDLSPITLDPDLERELFDAFDCELQARLEASSRFEANPHSDTAGTALWGPIGSWVRGEVRVPGAMVAGYLAVVVLLAGGVAVNHQRVLELQASVERREAVIGALQEQAARQSMALGGAAGFSSPVLVAPTAAPVGFAPNAGLQLGSTGVLPTAQPVSYSGPRVIH